MLFVCWECVPASVEELSDSAQMFAAQTKQTFDFLNSASTWQPANLADILHADFLALPLQAHKIGGRDEVERIPTQRTLELPVKGFLSVPVMNATDVIEFHNE